MKFLLCAFVLLWLIPSASSETRTNVVYHAEFAEADVNLINPTNNVVFRVWQTGDLKFVGITNGNNLTVIFSQPVRPGARFTMVSSQTTTNITEVVPVYAGEIANVSTVPLASQIWPPKSSMKVNAPKSGQLQKLPAFRTVTPPNPAAK